MTINRLDNKSLKQRAIYWIRLVSVGIISGVITACIGIELIFITAITHPVPSLVGIPPQRINNNEFQIISFLNEVDGVSLSGWFCPGENGVTIILLHGYGGNRRGMLSRANILTMHGYGVLLYDLRGHGESGGEVRSFGWQDVSDVKAALEFLGKSDGVDPDQIGILGFSIGGQIAIRAAAEYDEIKAVIADDPSFVTIDDAPRPKNVKESLYYLVSWITSRGVSLWSGVPIPTGIVDELAEISPRPILFIATGKTKGRDTVRNFYDNADQPKDYWGIPKANHGNLLNTHTDEYEQKVIDFFDRYLLDK
jgi:pimeloyl-ACP methyl ester carboxylesterase